MSWPRPFTASCLKFFKLTSSLEEGVDDEQLENIDDSRQFTKIKLAMFYSFRLQISPVVIPEVSESSAVNSNEPEDNVDKTDKSSDVIKIEVTSPQSTSHPQLFCNVSPFLLIYSKHK